MHARLIGTVGASLLVVALSACGGSGGESGSSSSTLVADAGSDQSAPTNTLITLDGSGSSTTGGELLSYEWSVDGPAPGDVSLTDANTVAPSFVPTVDGTYDLTLIIGNGISRSTPDSVTVTVSGGNSSPIANAGPNQNVATGSTVVLQGGASADANGDELNYQWMLSAVPEGSAAEISNVSPTTTSVSDVDGKNGKVALMSATVIPNPDEISNASSMSATFVADLDGDYVVDLIVSDGIEESATDSVTIFATTQNSIPVATAGPDQEVGLGSTVTLDGSASTDADGDAITYEWTVVSSPTSSAVSLDSADSAASTFIADTAGSYVLALAVSDGLSTSRPDNIRIDATRPRVQLLRQDSGFFGSGAFNESGFPFSSNGNSTVSKAGIPPPTTHSFETFKLIAKGGDFTIDNLTAVDATSQVTPYFTNISDGYVLTDGEEVEFELVSPLTRGATVILEFSFEIRETGERLVVRQTFLSN